MTAPESESTDRWRVALRTVETLGAFNADRHGIAGLWRPLEAVGESSTDGDTREVAGLLGRVASMFVRPSEWNEPYEPAISIDGKRSTIHTDFTEEETATLRASAPHIPHPLLRARVCDIVALLSPPRDRLPLQIAHIDSILLQPITQSWSAEHEAWDRALLVARRYGKPMRSRLALLERALRQALNSKVGFAPLQIAEMLKSHGLARDKASAIAARLSRIAAAEKVDADRTRAYRAGASAWFAWAGDSEASCREKLLEVQSFVDEGERLSGAGSHDAMRAADLFERGLRALRTIPRSARVELGVQDLPAILARRIRESGAASLGGMHAYSSPTVDLTGFAKQSTDRVKGKTQTDALLAFATLETYPSFADLKDQAEKLLKEHPLQALFTTVHFSSDGRRIARSSGGGKPIYSTDPATWKQIIQGYELRISLLVTGAIWPAYVQLTNEHHLTVNDWATVAANAGIVPQDRVVQYARALYHGYNGDFSTAMQLATPQIENLVRHHLANAGITTSTWEDGIEMEIGLSGLMEREKVDEIFPEDLAFEIRALFCGPLGPNLRNEVAHGLISDGIAGGAYGLYCWWFAFRLAFIPFWNSLHDPDAADAREPQRPNDSEDSPIQK